MVEQLEDRTLLAAIITVNTAADADVRDAELSLREAIEVSNRTLSVASLTSQEQAQISGTPTADDADTIGFNIAGSGVHTTSPATALPTITDSVTIDGYTQPGAHSNTNAINDLDPANRGLNGQLLIQLTEDGNSTASINGLTITGNGSTIRGLIINGFRKSGIAINGGSNNVVAGNYLGTDLTGKVAMGNGTWGIQVNGGASTNIIGTNGDGIDDAAERNLISGNGGGGVAVAGSGTNGNIIAGNLVGTNNEGMAGLGNANRGVDVYGGAQHNLVGTNVDGISDGAERNVISANGWEGVAFYDPGTSFNTIAGNFVGTDVAGKVALGNARSGIAVWGGATQSAVGGLLPAARNVFSGNTLDGIEISSAGTADNVVEGNFSGTDSSGTLPLGNLRDGIRVWHGAVRTTIGGLAAGAANVVAFNQLSGVAVLSPDAVDNAVDRNAIFQNGGLGIDLGEDGATANDAVDADSGPNHLQNVPVIIAATALGGGQLSVSYSVPSDPANSKYSIRVEFFKADAAGEEGQTFLGDDLYEATEFGSGPSIVFTPLALVAPGDKIVATATDNFGVGNTSEFSAPRTVRAAGCSTLVVNTNDAGAGSLRDALTCANNTPGLDTIGFDIPGAGVHTISPTSALPAITDPVIIDGYTQPGANPNTDPSGFNGKLLIELSGAVAGDVSALAMSTLGASNTTVRGLVINRFSGGFGAITAGQSIGLHIEGNLIGTDPTGTSAMPNLRGLLVQDLVAGVIGGTTPASRNIISGNTEDGIDVVGAIATQPSLLVQGNFIGTQRDGLSPLGNGRHGVFVFSPNDGIIIGGTAGGAGNRIAFNAGTGVLIQNGVTAAPVLSNAIYQNGLLGIDLNQNGFTANDTDDADSGANNLQNYPEISYATRDAGQLKLKYSVSSDPANAAYPLRVEFFKADADGQEGQVYLGFDTFTAADFAAGAKTITLSPPVSVLVFDKIVATATDSLAAGGWANTSEFSPGVTIASPWHNPRHRYDVDDNGQVVPHDALLVINDLNSFGPGSVPSSAANSQPFFDTNGDNLVAPKDALDVINYLNTFGPGGPGPAGEGEAAAAGGQQLDDLLALLAGDLAAQQLRRRR